MENFVHLEFRDEAKVKENNWTFPYSGEVTRGKGLMSH